MDFKKVLAIILKNFAEQQIDYAFIGGFAIGALGMMRNTTDLDLLVNKHDLGKIDQILANHLYRLRYRSENVSQYVSDLEPFGSIDLLHAFRSHTLAMLKRTRKIPIFQGQYEIPVLIPEDLIGLKLQAMINNPERQTMEQADIEGLMRMFYATLDWQIVAAYFDLFNLSKQFEELKTKYGHPQ